MGTFLLTNLTFMLLLRSGTPFPRVGDQFCCSVCAVPVSVTILYSQVSNTSAMEGIARWYHCPVRNQTHSRLTTHFLIFTENHCMRVQADVRVLSSPVMLLVCHCNSLLALGSPQYRLDTRKHFPHLSGPGEQQLPICDGQDTVRQFNTSGGVISTRT